MVRVEQLNTRSRAHFSTSWDQFHSYGTHVQITVSSAIYGLRPREASEASRSTAIVSAAAPLPLPHMYVRISARTQGWHPPAYHALQAVARTRHTMMARSHAASMGSRGGPAHKIAARSLRRDRAALSRARQWSHRPAPACRRAYDVAAARQALAATICQPTCRMLDSYAVVSMAASSEVTRLPSSSMKGCSQTRDVTRVRGGR